MTEREKPGDGHDWIEARRKCTLERKFEDLVNRVKEDAQKARGVRVDHSENGREIHVSYGARPARGTEVRMSFRLEADRISVGDEAGTIERFEVTVALDEFEKCQFFMDGRPVRAWEITKRALEPLLFRDPLA